MSFNNDEYLYVVTHKPFELSQNLINKGYRLINVGKNSRDNKGFQDSTEDNISSKNDNYCELTAVYWIWKNTNSDIKGFCHYRRYFTFPTFKYNEPKIISYQEAKTILSRPDMIIVPEKKYYNISSKELYLRCGFEKDLDITRNVILEKYPEYLEDYDEMLNGNSGYITNMIIAQKDVFNRYCTWLFDILFEVEKRTDLTGYSFQEARVFGYISERLIGVWIQHNHLKTYEMECINPETDDSLRFFLYRLSMKLKIYKKIKDFMWMIHKCCK